MYELASQQTVFKTITSVSTNIDVKTQATITVIPFIYAYIHIDGGNDVLLTYFIIFSVIYNVSTVGY